MHQLKTFISWGLRFDSTKLPNCQVTDAEGEPVFIIKHLAGCAGELLRAGCEGELLRAGCDGELCVLKLGIMESF